MTTIKEVKEFKKANGKKGWVFVLDDGKEGFITNDKPWEYEAGQSVDYTLEVKKKSNGETYNLITFTTPNNQPVQQQSKNVGEQLSEKFANPAYFKQPKSYDEMKCDLRVAILQSLGVIVAAGKIEPKEITTYFNDIYPALDLSIDDLSK